MEDAATAEICRMLLWQWRRFEAPLDDGRPFDETLFARMFDEEVAALGDIPHLTEAARLFASLIRSDDPAEYLTVPAQRLLDRSATG